MQQYDRTSFTPDKPDMKSHIYKVVIDTIFKGKYISTIFDNLNDLEIAFIQTFRSELESLITTLIQNPFDIYTNIESLYTKLLILRKYLKSLAFEIESNNISLLLESKKDTAIVDTKLNKIKDNIKKNNETNIGFNVVLIILTCFFIIMSMRKSVK